MGGGGGCGGGGCGGGGGGGWGLRGGVGGRVRQVVRRRYRWRWVAAPALGGEGVGGVGRDAAALVLQAAAEGAGGEVGLGLEVVGVVGRQVDGRERELQQVVVVVVVERLGVAGVQGREGGLQHGGAQGKARHGLLLRPEVGAHGQGRGARLDIVVEGGAGDGWAGRVVELGEGGRGGRGGVDLGGVDLLDVEGQGVLVVGRGRGRGRGGLGRRGRRGRERRQAEGHAERPDGGARLVHDGRVGLGQVVGGQVGQVGGQREVVCEGGGGQGRGGGRGGVASKGVVGGATHCMRGVRVRL